MKLQHLALSAIGLLLSACQSLPQPLFKPGGGQPSSAPGAVPVTIVTGSYKSCFKIDKLGWQRAGENQDRVTLLLTPGTHNFAVTGAGASQFQFQVGKNGEVSNPTNQAAASVVGKNLVLRTKNVLVDTGMYGNAGGKCLLTANYKDCRDPWIERPTVFPLVPGLVYLLDNGESVGTSSFAFYVCADGEVRAGSPAASGSGRATAPDGTTVDGVLKLNGVLMKVMPPDRAEYRVGKSPKLYSGEQSVPVLPGLTTTIYPKEGDRGGQILPQYQGSIYKVSVGWKTFKWMVKWDWEYKLSAAD